MSSSSARPRRSYAKGRRRREEILRTALAVFAQQGYRGSSLREIAAAVELSQAGLLHHFGSKEELLAAVLAERDHGNIEAMPAHEERLFDGLRALVAHNAGLPGIVRLHTTLSAESTDPDHPAHGFFVERYAELRALTAGHVRAAMGRGEVRTDAVPEVVAQILLAVMDGLQVQWLLDPDVDMVAAFDAYLDGLLVELAPDGQASASSSAAPAPAPTPAQGS